MLNRASIFEKKLLIRLRNLRFACNKFTLATILNITPFSDICKSVECFCDKSLRVFVQFYTFSALYFVIFTHFWHFRYNDSACWDEQAEESP